MNVFRFPVDAGEIALRCGGKVSVVDVVPKLFVFGANSEKDTTSYVYKTKQIPSVIAAADFSPA